MKDIVETKEKYIIQRYFVNRVHKKSLFSVEIYPGIVAEFGEPKSKLGIAGGSGQDYGTGGR